MKMHDLPDAGSTEALESRLVDAYTVVIPPQLGARLEQRVSAAIELWRPSNSAGTLPASPRRRRLALIPVLLAVFLVTAAAAAGFFHFYDEAGGLAWQRAEHLGLVQTVDGYRLTLERVYADANRMLVGVTVVDEQNRGWSQVAIDDATVTDTSGGRWEEASGMSRPEGGGMATNLIWFDAVPGPAVPGRRAFSLSVPEVAVIKVASTPTPWRNVEVDVLFSFDLTVGGGAQATPHAAAESNGVTITLDRIVASPSTVRLELDVAGIPPASTAWAPIMSVRHAGVDLAVVLTTSGGGSGTTNWTSGGVDDPSGEWIVTVTEEVGEQYAEGTADTQIRLHGPWILHFTLP